MDRVFRRPFPRGSREAIVVGIAVRIDVVGAEIVGGSWGRGRGSGYRGVFGRRRVRGGLLGIQLSSSPVVADVGQTSPRSGISRQVVERLRARVSDILEKVQRIIGGKEVFLPTKTFPFTNIGGPGWNSTLLLIPKRKLSKMFFPRAGKDALNRGGIVSGGSGKPHRGAGKIVDADAHFRVSPIFGDRTPAASVWGARKGVRAVTLQDLSETPRRRRADRRWPAPGAWNAMGGGRKAVWRESVGVSHARHRLAPLIIETLDYTSA